MGASRFDPLPPDRGEDAGRAVAIRDADADNGDGRLLELIGQAEEISRDDYARRLQRMVGDSQRAWRNEHSQGSKYLDKLAFRGRSRLFVPKSRVGIRKNKAGAAAALFATDDVISISAEYDDDPAQLASARVLKQIMNYRLSRVNHKSGMPWFQIAVAGRHGADVEGCTISKQYWDFREVPTGKTKREMIPVQDEMGATFYEEQEIPEMNVTRDRPMIELLPYENVYVDPAAPWYDPVQLGAWFIARYPMHLNDVKAMLSGEGKHGNGPQWLNVSDEVLRKGFKDDQRSTARRARERGVDRLESMGMPREWDIIWVNENFVRHDDEDMCFWSVGRHAYLSEPRPTEEVYPEQYGMRPYVMGVAEVEPHVTSPMPPVYSWQPLQLELNDLTNLRLDATKRSIAPLAKIKRGKGVDFDQVRRRGQPEAMLLLDDPEKDVVFEATPPPPNAAYTDVSQVNNAFDELSGQFSSSSVQSNRQLNETVGGMKMISGATDFISEFDLRTWLETWAEPALRQVVNLIQWYESDDKVVALAGRKSEAWQRHGVNPTLDMLLEAEVTLKINAGIGAQNPMQMLQKLGGALTMLEPMFPLMQSQGIMPNMEEFISEIMGRTGYSDGKRFFTFGEPPPPGAGDPQAEAEMAKVEAQKEFNQGKLQLEEQKAAGKMQLEERKTEGQLQLQDKKIKGDIYAKMATAQMQTEANMQQSVMQAQMQNQQAEAQGDRDADFRQQEIDNSHQSEMAKVFANREVGLEGAKAKATAAGAKAGSNGAAKGKKGQAALPAPQDSAQAGVMKQLIKQLEALSEQQSVQGGSQAAAISAMTQHLTAMTERQMQPAAGPSDTEMRLLMMMTQMLDRLDSSIERMGGPKRVVRDPTTNEIIGVVPVDTTGQITGEKVSLTHGDACKVALAEALSDFTNVGTTAPKLRVFDSGSTLLVSITLSTVSAFTVSTAQTSAAINGTPSGVAVATGIPDSFDILNGEGNTVYEGSAGPAGSTFDLTLDVAAQITVGETVSIASHEWELTP